MSEVIQSGKLVAACTSVLVIMCEGVFSFTSLNSDDIIAEVNLICWLFLKGLKLLQKKV